MRTGAIALACAAALAGCPSVPGPCDIDAAKRVVVDERGATAYEGQALVFASCGFGAFCHGDGIPAEARRGAPHGMDFDLEIASRGTDVGEIARLERSFLRVYELRGSIWSEVDSERMPPGDIGQLTLRDERAPRYARDGIDWDVETVLGSDEGREALRNWLACGNPVVERVLPCEPADPLCTSVGFIEPTRCGRTEDCLLPAAARCAATGCVPCTADADCTHIDSDGDMIGDRPRCTPLGECACLSDADCGGTRLCDTATGACFAPIQPTWPAIYTSIIAARCADESCHAGTNPGGELDMSDRALARTSLLGAEAQSLSCRLRSPRPIRVVPGDPDASLFVHKILGVDATGGRVCGERMPYESEDPLPLQYVDAIREWIAAGALEN